MARSGPRQIQAAMSNQVFRALSSEILANHINIKRLVSSLEQSIMQVLEPYEDAVAAPQHWQLPMSPINPPYTRIPAPQNPPTYERPKDDVFDFFIYSFVTSAIYLMVTGRANFNKSLSFQYLVTACIIFASYIFPAAILARILFAVEPSPSGGARCLLYANFVLALAFFGATVITLALKHLSSATRNLGLMDMHTFVQSGLRNRPWLWWKTMAYFSFRFVLIYFAFMPLSLLLSLCYIIFYSPPTIGFPDVLFFIAFLTVLTALSVTLYVRLGWYQSVVHAELVVHSFIFCYFLSDDKYLAKMLMSFLSIYLATFYSIVVEPKGPPPFYNMPHWFYFQILFWRKYSDLPIKSFQDPSSTFAHRTVQKYHDLLHPAKPRPPPPPREPTIGPQDQQIGR